MVNEVVAAVVAGGAPPHPETSVAAKPMHAPITAARAAGALRNVSMSGPVDGRMASKR
ncbi:hypothetical protein [Mycobacterium colombiense]|uniref:hypothetical protein n=1 Tax=Mycobacterium colombiense TaxID=339268 RepID=UPI001E41BAE3|nr:hypothetical protein [Mycobacterium colombiense]